MSISPTPLSFNVLCLVNPFKFLDVLYYCKNLLGLSAGEDFLNLACVILTVPAYDRWRTDRQTDKRTVRWRL